MSNPNQPKKRESGNRFVAKMAGVIGGTVLALTGCAAPQPAQETPTAAVPTSTANIPSATPSITPSITPTPTKAEQSTLRNCNQQVQPIDIDKDNETQTSFIEQFKQMPNLPNEVELADPTKQTSGNEAKLSISNNNKVITLKSNNDTFESTTIFTDEASKGEEHKDETVAYSITKVVGKKDILNANFTYVVKTNIINSDKKALTSRVKEAIKAVDNNGKKDKLGNNGDPKKIVLNQSTDLSAKYYGNLFFMGGSDVRATDYMMVFFNNHGNTTGNYYFPNKNDKVRNLGQKEMCDFKKELDSIISANGANGSTSLDVGYNPDYAYKNMKELYQGLNYYINPSK